jgi:hypothetical protein
MEGLFASFLSLVGTAALIAAIVNVAKVFGLKDGYANSVSAVLSTIAFGVLVYLQVFAPEVDIYALDESAKKTAETLLYALGLAVQLGLPVRFHQWFVSGDVPFLGYSHTLDDDFSLEIVG